ncbi:MAG: hypothetical protein BJ554DRAFT_38 [Olpidium bornovanus]|uniref:C3H1-type domain-containing protein n=1 Tax=Olpidium bornovanus TaxID=278681 RepID=A0A8H8DIY7_9FUNG|nr:MAG: hypothetical protein BJ554DRAFT_38 [Olpidium bornovanus]
MAATVHGRSPSLPYFSDPPSFYADGAAAKAKDSPDYASVVAAAAAASLGTGEAPGNWDYECRLLPVRSTARRLAGIDPRRAVVASGSSSSSGQEDAPISEAPLAPSPPPGVEDGAAAGRSRDADVADMQRVFDDFRLRADGAWVVDLEHEQRVPHVAPAAHRHPGLLEPLSELRNDGRRTFAADFFPLEYEFPGAASAGDKAAAPDAPLPTFVTGERTVASPDAPLATFVTGERTVVSPDPGGPPYPALADVLRVCRSDGEIAACRPRRSSLATGGPPGSTAPSDAGRLSCYSLPLGRPASFDLFDFDRELAIGGPTPENPFAFVDGFANEHRCLTRRHSAHIPGADAAASASLLSGLLDGQAAAALPRAHRVCDAPLVRRPSVDTATSSARPRVSGGAPALPTAVAFSDRLLAAPLLYNGSLSGASVSVAQANMRQGAVRYALPNEHTGAQVISPPLPLGAAAKDPKKLALYKTELCRSYEETGTCRYGAKCQFAHGNEELRTVERHPKHKSVMCKTFWEKGSCPYGQRCCFIHTAVPSEHGSVSIQSRAVQSAVSSPSGSASTASVKSPLTPKDAPGTAASFPVSPTPCRPAAADPRTRLVAAIPTAKKRDSVSSVSSLYAEESDAVNTTINVSVEEATKLATRSNPTSPAKQEKGEAAPEPDRIQRRARRATHGDADAACVRPILSRRPSRRSISGACRACGSFEACWCAGAFAGPAGAGGAAVQQPAPEPAGRGRTVSASDAQASRLGEQTRHQLPGNPKQQPSVARTGRRASVAEGGGRRLPVFQSMQD